METETDGAARNAMIQEAFALHRDATGHIPLYLQYVTWGMKDGMELPSRPDGVVPLWRVRMPTGR